MEQRMSAVCTRMLKWMSVVAIENVIRNECTRGYYIKVEVSTFISYEISYSFLLVVSIAEQMRENSMVGACSLLMF